MRSFIKKGSVTGSSVLQNSSFGSHIDFCAFYLFTKSKMADDERRLREENERIKQRIAEKEREQERLRKMIREQEERRRQRGREE